MGFKIGTNCKIDPTATINVKEGFIGDGAIVRAYARIEGTKIEIGREAYIDVGASIGGGSCFDPDAFLMAGDWLHMGVNSHINIARGVNVGHEFGCGIETKIFTHGAYIDSYNLGAPTQWGPVKIGNNVWMPNAWVNPNIEVGDNVIVAARSLVNKSIPSGTLAGGIPAKIIKANYLPQKLTDNEKGQLINEIINVAQKRFVSEKIVASDVKLQTHFSNDVITIKAKTQTTTFNLKTKTIIGDEIDFSFLLKDQLRRNGIRFRFEVKNHLWASW